MISRSGCSLAVYITSVLSDQLFATGKWLPTIIELHPQIPGIPEVKGLMHLASKVINVKNG